MVETTNLLIVGAGPFGLTMAAHAADLGIEHRVVGKAMEFWKNNMPAGMFLRSASDWHLDAAGSDTMERFIDEQGLTPAAVEPLSRDFYLSYVQWFQERKQITPIEHYVRRLDYDVEGAPSFRATLDDGRIIAARQVVLAVGFRYFCHVPDDLAALLPAGRFVHSCELVDFTGLRDKRCLILGGRQGAYEWAALLHEAGAAAVHVSHRHPAPAFAVGRLVVGVGAHGDDSRQPGLVPQSQPVGAGAGELPAVGRGSAEDRAVARSTGLNRRRAIVARDATCRRAARATTARSVCGWTMARN